MLAVGLRPRQAVGTDLGIVLCGSIAGTIKHGLLGNVRLWIAMPLLVGSVLGVQLGAWICHVVHADKWRRSFAILVFAVAGAVTWDLLRKLVG